MKPIISICFFISLATAGMSQPDHSKVPGTIINYSPASTQRYIGSPSIVILPNGNYVTSHDFFGKGTNYDSTMIFQSADKGKTWRNISRMRGQWWSTLFLHQNALYIIGTSRENGYAVIRRSDDGGKNWTEPRNSNSGLLSSEDHYHCAPVPVVAHNGRLWRAFELSRGPRRHWRAIVMSAPLDADLLRKTNWQTSAPLAFPWPDADKGQWIEGNVVVTPKGRLVNILRTNGLGGDKAAIMHISEDGRVLAFDPEKDLIDFPGGGVKFTIRYDKESKKYWTLGSKQTNPKTYRNNLVLTASADLYNWDIKSQILFHPDSDKHAFQYIDWLFEGNDIIFVSRTAYDDGLGGAHRAHDANYITFHRINDFRKRKSVNTPLTK